MTNLEFSKRYTYVYNLCVSFYEEANKGDLGLEELPKIIELNDLCLSYFERLSDYGLVQFPEEKNFLESSKEYYKGILRLKEYLEEKLVVEL